MIRIAIVDDHAIVRAGLRQFLSEQVDLRVTGEASSGREALDLARAGEVDVMLMDLSLPTRAASRPWPPSRPASPSCRC